MAKAIPNLDWLEKAREELNADLAFRKLGSTDVILGIDVGGEARLVKFEAFEVTEISKVRPSDLRDADIVLSMSARDWNAYLRKREKGKGPSLLALDLEKRVIQSQDPLSRIKFERYNLTLQAFIDTGARLAV